MTLLSQVRPSYQEREVKMKAVGLLKQRSHNPTKRPKLDDTFSRTPDGSTPSLSLTDEFKLTQCSSHVADQRQFEKPSY